jgi:hypothetical protein
VRYDLKTVFLEHGTQKEFVSLKMQLAFLRDRLNHDDTMPPEFKARFRQAIDDFGSHAWIEEQVNSFLGQVIDTPESLFASPWAVEVEKK